ncbi:hypothetical protein [Candidatus Enterovibrio escicola]|uniref:hypothetical protein n=1 Tax=Candidatus Enterovibrio escicola TaxID=1927127 RepID=UPI001CC241A2|nr:hypothetical protein [Candidatus Enterovibrio escacola]
MVSKLLTPKALTTTNATPTLCLQGTEGQDAVWSVESITVVDEDGNELNAHELADYLDSNFSSINYSVLEIEQIIDVDVDEESEMETFTLDIDNAPNIRFTGELVANVVSSDN